MTKPLSEIRAQLRDFSWDSEAPLVELTSLQLRRNLARVTQGTLDLRDLVAWAEYIEGRDDIALEKEQEHLLRETIYRLASESAEGPVTLDTVLVLIRQIDERS